MYVFIEVAVCVAILYACQKYDFYLRGLPQFEVQADHRPLEGTFTRQMHSMDNAHLLRMREKMARYNFNVRWTPGKTNIIANVITRAHIFDPEKEELIASSTIECLAASKELMLLMTQNCQEYNLMWAYVQNSNHLITNDITAPYKKMWDGLNVANYRQT